MTSLRLNDRFRVNASKCAAIGRSDDYVLGHIRESPSEISGVRSPKRSIRQALPRSVGRDEVLNHAQSLTKVTGDWRLDDLTRGLGHQPAHSRKLANLLLTAASARSPPS